MGKTIDFLSKAQILPKTLRRPDGPDNYREDSFDFIVIVTGLNILYSPS